MLWRWIQQEYILPLQKVISPTTLTTMAEMPPTPGSSDKDSWSLPEVSWGTTWDALSVGYLVYSHLQGSGRISDHRSNRSMTLGKASLPPRSPASGRLRSRDDPNITLRLSSDHPHSLSQTPVILPLRWKFSPDPTTGDRTSLTWGMLAELYPLILITAEAGQEIELSVTTANQGLGQHRSSWDISFLRTPFCLWFTFLVFLAF